MTTRAQLLTALRMSGRELVETVRSLPNGAFEAGVYENGWNGKQLLAHMASIEWTHPNLIELAGRPAQDGAGPPQRPPGGGMDAYNARQVEKRADASVAELLAEFEANRAKTIAAVEAAPAELLERELISAGGLRGRLADVLRYVAVEHLRGHLEDLRRGSGAG